MESVNAPLWKAEDAARALGIALPAGADWVAENVSIDSRSVAAGDIFVAIVGERVDGHDFVKGAIEKGASAVVVSRAIEGVPTAQQLVVNDTTRALEQLGAFARARFAGKVVGVTGSVGKTSSKEALRLALAAYGQTFATQGNLNNHFGVPLTLSRMPASADFAVIEMGMNHAGEIRALTAQARPHVALVSTVEAVHIEFFDSIEGIARAKAEIFEGLETSGVAVMNGDNPHTPILQKASAAHTQILFGSASAHDVRILEVRVSREGTVVGLRVGQEEHQVVVRAIGLHWGSVVASVAAVLLALELPVAQGLAALSAFEEPVGRGRLDVLPYQGGSLALLDDSYNASAASMKSALEKLGLLRAQAQGAGRYMAVLGEMRELGAQSESLHQSLIPAIIAAKPDKVFASGAAMKPVFDALPESMRASYAPQAADLLPPLLAEMRAGDMLLCKGSHGSLIYQLVEGVRKHIES